MVWWLLVATGEGSHGRLMCLWLGLRARFNPTHPRDCTLPWNTLIHHLNFFANFPRPHPCSSRSAEPCSLFHEIINGLLELRSVTSGTSLDQHQWAELQQHLEETAAADAAAAAAAAVQTAVEGGQPPQQHGGEQQVQEAAQAKSSMFGVPGCARHSQPQIVHHRTGSIAASMRVGHIPAGSTDAGG